MSKDLQLFALFVLSSITSLLFAISFPPAQTVIADVRGRNLPALSHVTASDYDWLEFGFDGAHSGDNNLESLINRANVNTLQRLYQIALPSVADGAPAYLSSVSTPGGVKNLVFLTTRDGRIVARDADDGSAVWSQQHGPGTCKINNGSTTCYTTSSPAIDPNRLFVYSYGLDGLVHKYRVGDGTEITTGGWPETATLKGFDEKGSSALSVITDANSKTYLYMTNGGYPGDNGDYQGHITAINLADGSQHVFNTMCSDQAVHFVEMPGTPDCADVQSAIWARPGVIYDSDTEKIYMATGNGTFSPGNHFWGDTVFSLHTDGTGTNGNPLDTFTPANFQLLQNQDADLGSTAPAILPTPLNSTVHHLAVQGGKDAKLRLLNLDDLSGQGGTGHTGGEVGVVIGVPQSGPVLTQPAVWTNPNDGSTWVYVANGSGLSALKLVLDANNAPLLQFEWKNASGGTSPILANGVLYYVGTGSIKALDPTNGSILWNDSQIGGIHWQSPIVANGVVNVADQIGNLTAYALNGAPPPTPTPTPTPFRFFLPFILRRY